MAKERANSSGDGWDEWRNKVLSDLERIEKKVEALSLQQCSIGKKVEGLKVASGLWGAAAACVPIAIMVAVQMIKG